MSKTISITNARKDIYKISDYVCEVHEEVIAYNASTGKNVVILSEEDWRSIQETLRLSSMSGMVESILEAKDEALSEGSVYKPGEEW